MVQSAIRVVARICPLRAPPAQKRQAAEPAPVAPCCRVCADGQTVEHKDEDGRTHSVRFDAAVDGTASQDDIFVEVAPNVIDRVYDGYNACVLAYGQTGSGKTHTMLGSKQDPGLVSSLMTAILARQTAHTTVHISAVQLYGERFHDLLAPPPPAPKGKELPAWGADPAQNNPFAVRTNVRVRELRDVLTGQTLFRLQGQERRPLVAGEVFATLKEARERQIVAATKMNVQSSRSHVVISIEVTQDVPLECKTITSTLYLVDLAGCESVTKSGLNTAVGARLMEAIAINKSLSNLKRVMECLADHSRERRRDRDYLHIPFRNSVLTMLLRECMGGNSATTLICTVSPDPVHASETKSTLFFGQASSSIVNVVTRNVAPSFEELQKRVKASRLEVGLLRSEVDDLLKLLPAGSDAVAEAQAMLASLSKEAGGGGRAADNPRRRRGEEPDVFEKGALALPAEATGHPKEFVCALDAVVGRNRLMDDPVVAADGRTYNRAALHYRFAQCGAQGLSDDMGGAPGERASTSLPVVVQSELLCFPNRALSSQILAYEQKRMWPQDTLCQVFLYLDYFSVVACGATCRRWRGASELDTFWARMCGRDFEARAVDAKVVTLRTAMEAKEKRNGERAKKRRVRKKKKKKEAALAAADASNRGVSKTKKEEESGDEDAGDKEKDEEVVEWTYEDVFVLLSGRIEHESRRRCAAAEIASNKVIVKVVVKNGRKRFVTNLECTQGLKVHTKKR